MVSLDFYSFAPCQAIRLDDAVSNAVNEFFCIVDVFSIENPFTTRKFKVKWFFKKFSLIKNYFKEGWFEDGRRESSGRRDKREDRGRSQGDRAGQQLRNRPILKGGTSGRNRQYLHSEECICY